SVGNTKQSLPVLPMFFPSPSLSVSSHPSHEDGGKYCQGQVVSRGDAFPSPGSFPRTPEPLAQGPISLLTLEKQYLHPRAL
uniref:Uncharacterized protein n=1 Tax=Serinus canaria TaxID=9135 RepID=A0A8C9MLA6_SERCA